MKFDIWEFN